MGYEQTTGDEVEDMHQLLLDVKHAHPDVQGVSVGVRRQTRPYSVGLHGSWCPAGCISSRGTLLEAILPLCQ
jgi:hypothetical protein